MKRWWRRRSRLQRTLIVAAAALAVATALSSFAAPAWSPWFGLFLVIAVLAAAFLESGRWGTGRGNGPPGQH